MQILLSWQRQPNDDKTKENGGEITFDSASTELPEQVKKAAFALDEQGF